MRWFLVGLVGCLLPVACGGATPPPKDSDDVAPSKAEKTTDTPPAEHADTASPSASAAAAEPAKAEPAATATEVKPPADDVWMAPHQMPPKDVLKTMRPAQGKVHACFHAGTKRDPSTQGEVKIRFVITNDGKVRAWKDDGSSMTDEEVTKCVGELVKTLSFPKQKSPGDAWGTYTANFTN
jgi:hypothetical protein